MRILASVLVLFIVTGLAPSEYALPSRSASSAFLCTIAKSYEPLAWIEGGERFSAGATVFVRDARGRRPLAPSFAASADPAVSFDGKNGLFAGKRTAREVWQIWEVSLYGGEPRRITNCPEGCIRPFYLPEGRIVYGEKIERRFVIKTATVGGNESVALTYAPASSLPTDVLRDGRVLFEATSPFEHKGLAELYTVYSDGSGVESYRCDHGQARHSGKQVASGDIVFAVETGLARFTSALAKGVSVPAPEGEYAGDVAETTSGEWLLAWRRDRNSQFQLMWWKPGQASLQPALRERGSDVVEPVLVGERSVPNRHPSALHEWPVGNLLCLNAYTSKYKFAPASIQSVRFYTRDVAGNSQLLGTAPVEADGSFFVQVPGDQPLQIEVLDGAGKTLKREAGWFWIRKGEQRACVGCHAGPETAPENAVPMALLKSTTPADMTRPLHQTSAGGH